MALRVQVPKLLSIVMLARRPKNWYFGLVCEL